MKDNYGFANRQAVKKLEKIAKLVEAKSALYASMTDEVLASQTQVLKDRYQNGETLDKLLPDAYAVCREASARVLKQRHYHVQILGGIALHQGRICQMATGEGKTLTETLPAYLNALTGNGVHIITVNEYLATRDMEWMGKVFRFLGLTVGVTLSNMTNREKQRAYKCDITYGTNNEFGFDYLRDNMCTARHQCVQRGLNFVIVDEVDSILIDEARTPLIISGPSGKSSAMYVTANRFVVTLRNSTNVDEEGKTENKEIEPNGDYVVDQKSKQVRLTDVGIAKAERFFKVDNLSHPDNMEINHHINNARRAHAIMHRDDDYIVEKGQILIVDSFTGRKMEGRRFSAGLHQAIEAKEHVTIKEENKTLATITFQNYFRLYRKMSGMTGTAKTEEKEFNTIYNIDVVAIPTNLPVVRKDLHDLFFATRKAKLNAIVEEIKQRNAIGQPVLVGTVTVEKSEEIAKLLDAERIKYRVLNAKQHKQEASIIAQAGRLGAITIATNMAGRGTDILLGGNPEFLAKQEMKKLGYDDEQIELSTSFVAKDEETEKLQHVFRDLVAKHKVQTDEEKRRVVEVGGLCVIGTERHDSRRIDDQLRGRAGRQGDPGCSVFFLSAEDDMMRIFASDMIQNVMRFLHFDEDKPIEHRALTNIIRSAQARIEGIHFSSRKQVLQYDDVNNHQRKVIYGERNKIMDQENIHQDILNMADDYARKALEDACQGEEDVSLWDLEEVNKRLAMYFPVEQPVLQQHQLTNARDVCKILAELCRELLDTRFNEEEQQGVVPFRESERYMLLRTMDSLWMDHIDALDDLRKGVGLQAIGQHDPLLVYKKEAFDMFETLNETIIVQTIRKLFFAKLLYTMPTQPTGGSDDKADGKKGSANKAQQSQQDPNRPLTKKEEYALKRQQRKAEKNKKK